MKINQQTRSIILAILGIILICGYFWMFGNSKSISLLTLHVPQDEIVAQAEELFQKSQFKDHELTRSIDVNINSNLLRYAQQNSDKNDFYPIGSFEVQWRGKIDTEKGENKSVHFDVEYDFKGNLIGLSQNFPEPEKMSKLQEAEALTKSKMFLASLPVDTLNIVLTEKNFSEEDNIPKYDFSFTLPSSISPDLKEDIRVGIFGTEIRDFEIDTSVDKEKFKTSEFDKIAENISIGAMIVIWLVISIVATVVFIKRLRHDEIEFKHAVWIGASIFVFIWLIIAIQNWGNWAGVLLGGGFAGLFAGGGLLLAYAVTESLTRDTWKKKLVLVDLFFQGRFRIREFGAAILDVLFISGLILIIFSCLLWISNYFEIGYFNIDNDNMWILRDNLKAVTAFFGNLVSVFIITLILLIFWPTYLRSKIKNKTVLILFTALSFNIAYLHLSYLRPTYVSFIMLLPLAVIWGYITYSKDFVTTLLIFISVYIFSSLAFITISPEGFSNTAIIATGVFVALFFICGIILTFTKYSAQDFENYVPEYVSRIAERERFLQELEIARSVQMRFLPKSVPDFPNLEIASVCRPAMEIGGDYYDFIRDGDDHLGVVIGDVSGKGVSAAFYMTMAKGIIKTLAKQTKKPKQLLTKMNTIFYENAPRGVFISAIYGLFDIKNKTLTFARAGHNPLIFRKSMGVKTELLNPGGLAIGLDEGTIFATAIREKTVPIETGDLFVFYTDGVSESMDKNGDEFGEERLSALINENTDYSAQALLEKITNDVDHFAGKMDQHDDFTMVVVKVGV